MSTDQAAPGAAPGTRPEDTEPTLRTDPVRALVAFTARQRGVTLRQLSALCGRNPGWAGVYLHKGTPRELDKDARAAIARALDLDEAKLCAPGQAPAGAIRPGRPALDPVLVADIPVFGEDDLIVPDQAAEWAPRPSDAPGAGGMFALQVVTGGSRTRPGDLLYVANRPPRVGDLTVCLRDNRVAAIGELAHMDATVCRLNVGHAMRDLHIGEHRFHKVTSLVTA